MLTAKDIAVARAAARDCPPDGELDRESRIEFYMIGDAKCDRFAPWQRAFARPPSTAQTIANSCA